MVDLFISTVVKAKKKYSPKKGQGYTRSSEATYPMKRHYPYTKPGKKAKAKPAKKAAKKGKGKGNEFLSDSERRAIAKLVASKQ